MLIPTPYYRSLVQTNSLGCEEFSDSNYGPYQLFVLNTRLFPIVYRMFGREVDIIFRSVYNNDRMELKIDVVRIINIPSLGEPKPNPTVDMSSDQYKYLSDTVEKIVATDMEYCLIDKKELYIASGKMYPESWFYTMLGYLDLPTEYNPFVRSDGIYLTFNPNADYKTAYNKVVEHILNQMDQYYTDGAVFGANNIVEQWKLEPIDIEEVRRRVFIPTWTDKRFALHPVEFLLEKIQGDSYIKIKVPDNLVQRHSIANILNNNKINMIYEGDKIKIPIDGLDQAQYAAALVERGKSIGKGKVITIPVNRPSWILLYMEAAKSLNLYDSVGYQIDDVEKPYIFSLLVPFNSSSESVIKTLSNIVMKKLTELQSQLLDKNLSPHEYIETNGSLNLIT